MTNANSLPSVCLTIADSARSDGGSRSCSGPGASWPPSRSSSLGVLEGHAREGDGGHDQLRAEGLLDLGAVNVLDDREHVCEPALLEGHHVLVGVDPGDLRVDARELGVMAGGEGGVGAEHGADLEYAPEARGHRHLLVELRRLGQVGGAVEVLDLEQLRSGLARRAHELRRVDLDELLFAPVLPHRVLGRRLHLEDQPAVGPAQVQVAPVDALVQGRVGRDRHLRLGERIDLQVLELQLQASQLHTLVGHHRAGDRDRRLRRQRGDALVELRGRLRLREHDLGET